MADFAVRKGGADERLDRASGSDRGCQESESIGQAHRMLVQLPSAQPTIYGYDIDCLQFIAVLMREKGITTEEAVTMFADYGRMAEWIRSQVLSEIEKTIKEQCGIG